MIAGIDMNRRNEIIEARRELFSRLHLANKDKTAIADYLDCFDTRCVPLAIKCLPKREQKQYAAKQHELLAGLNSLRKRVGTDERKMYVHMNKCAKKFDEFVKLAFTGPVQVSQTALQELYNAEFSSTIARNVYQAVEPKYKKECFTDHEQ